MERVDCLVVGAGVVGLAIARRLAQSGLEVVVVEAADDVGTGTSARNSEVIHAGIYYPAESRKARLCVRGRELLYRYCADRDVPYRRVGKLIVAATPDQIPALDSVRRRGVDNGVHDLRQIDVAELRDLEPAVSGAGALLSGSTGIVDSAGLVHALRRDLEDAGGAVALRTRFLRGSVAGFRITVELSGTQQVSCGMVINSAGLGAWDVARSLSGAQLPIPPRYLAKGNYFRLESGRAPFSHLVYPLPVDGGLGVHYTLDLGGTGRFGPDVEWTDAVDYVVDDTRARAFEDAIIRYWPALPRDSLTPDYAGVRPKISGPGEPTADFLVQGPRTHGVEGLVNLFGIESPGLTSCLALADDVADELTAS
ncbi:NAD(P)/FAD-dependent oxidoreductase [Gordonia sp. NPDC003585]|uniref:NAD(P)/FAD-dependent oxidoreductase n=1 Tax=Gordonia sp. NPDC003585 TaxID=3154275 RepID=UPI0033A06D0A